MELLEMYRENGVSREVYAFGETVLKTLAPRFAQLDAMAEVAVPEDADSYSHSSLRSAVSHGSGGLLVEQ